MPHPLGLQSITIITLNASAHQSVFKASRIILLRLYHLTSHLNAFESFRWEIVDIDSA